MKKYKSNNIVLLIGNGFDLAHDFKTSYNDFSNWFITKIEENIKEYFSEKRNNKNFFNKEEFLEYFKDSHKSKTHINVVNRSINKYFSPYISEDSIDINTTLSKNTNQIQRIISNKFLGKLYDNQYDNWFDIENAYFHELIKLKNNIKIIKNQLKSSTSQDQYYRHNETLNTYKKWLKKLNSELIEIKNYLKEYLKTVEIQSNESINGFFNTFSVFDDIDYNIFIINFNYTNTIEYYFSEFTNGNTNIKSVNINYIHGNLKEDNIIFGYGNDKHKEYQEIKDLEIDEFLENFKTFAYLKNNNYSKIYDDILDNNSVNDYVIFVLGHSLGATDKTLLEEIFNNKKCKKIHLFKRIDNKGDEKKLVKSYNNLVFTANRILTTENDLRKKILNYKDSEFFP